MRRDESRALRLWFNELCDDSVERKQAFLQLYVISEPQVFLLHVEKQGLPSSQQKKQNVGVQQTLSLLVSYSSSKSPLVSSYTGSLPPPPLAPVWIACWFVRMCVRVRHASANITNKPRCSCFPFLKGWVPPKLFQTQSAPACWEGKDFCVLL